MHCGLKQAYSVLFITPITCKVDYLSCIRFLLTYSDAYRIHLRHTDDGRFQLRSKGQIFGLRLYFTVTKRIGLKKTLTWNMELALSVRLTNDVLHCFQNSNLWICHMNRKRNGIIKHLDNFIDDHTRRRLTSRCFPLTRATTTEGQKFFLVTWKKYMYRTVSEN